MLVVRIVQDGSVEVAVAEPQPLTGRDVRVDVTYCGICGSDLKMLRRDEKPVGLILGHEFSGQISEIGADLTGSWAVGDRVAVRPIDDCGECRACTTGEGVCMVGLTRGPGLGRPGGFSQSTVVPETMLFGLPDSVSDEAGALVEPLAVAVHAVDRSGMLPDEAVCVLGAGSIGFMTVVALRARSAENVVVVEPNAKRRERVADLGVRTCDPDEAPSAIPSALGGPPAVVIDCSAHPNGVPLALSLLPQRGRVVVVGMSATPVPTDYFALATKELSIIGSLAYSAQDFNEAIDHLATGRVPVDHIVTSVRSLHEAADAIEDLQSGNSSHVKVLLRP